jgi:uncharacterized membrane protein
MLTFADEQRRLSVLKRLIETAHECLSLRNFHATYAIYVGLNMWAVQVSIVVVVVVIVVVVVVVYICFGSFLFLFCIFFVAIEINLGWIEHEMAKDVRRDRTTMLAKQQ